MADQHELEVAVAPTGGWLPDETLFSIASRYHRIAGHRWASTTCLALFGHSRIGSAHDLPARVDEFAARTRGRLGDSVSIIWRRTVLPYFLPYRSPAVANDAIAAMRGTSIGSLKFRLGLLTSRFRANLPLKACCACIERDITDYNVAYWHRQHQFPGVWVCDIDGSRLHQYEIKVSGEGRFDWVLPDDLSAEVEGRPSTWPEGIKDRLARLAQAAQALGRVPYGFHFDTSLEGRCHHQALSSRGFLGRGGRLRLDELAESYFEFAAGLQLIPELSTLPSDKAMARTQISRVLYRPEAGTHPLRRLLLTVWLHGNWETFADLYRSLGSERACPQDDPEPHTPNATVRAVDPRISEATKAVKEQGLSPTAVARKLGVDVSTVIAWLAIEGIATDRRPKKLKPPIYAQLIRLIEDGASKSTATAQAGVSASTITKLLRSEPGLRARWNASRLSATRTEHQKTWQDLLELNPSSSTPVLRAVAAKAYAWLYRNDRAWLSASIAARASLPQRPGTRVDWDARDDCLATEVRKAAEQICAITGRQRCTVAAICASIPELRAKLGAMDQLPRTARAIGDATWPRRRHENGTLL